jgi:hypothetical protein
MRGGLVLAAVAYGVAAVGCADDGACGHYVEALEACAAAASPGDTGAPSLDLGRCPDDGDLTRDQVDAYHCLAKVWTAADCATADGVLAAASEAATCGEAE